MECWETLCELISQRFADVVEWQYCNTDLFTPEFWISYSSQRPWCLQVTVRWYNRQTKTSVSPDDSVKDVGPARWLTMSCTWNIILSSAKKSQKVPYRWPKHFWSSVSKNGFGDLWWSAFPCVCQQCPQDGLWESPLHLKKCKETYQKGILPATVVGPSPI